MILDRIENKDIYIKNHPLFAQAFAFMEEHLKNPREAGKYEIVGKDLYAMVQCYDTKADARFETHERYIDIQFMVNGRERVLWCEKDGMTPSCDYNPEKDAQFFEDSGNAVEFLLTSGRFAIFFPSDAHKPALTVNDAEPVEKIVVKILL